MRIVAGRLRGRRLHAPRGGDTRPTSERARTGVFDWLGPRVAGRSVLDLFAGSGGLGLESLSRGALQATFVESGRAARSALGRNLADLDLVDCARMLPYDVGRGVRMLLEEGARFELVFADPPYGDLAAPWTEGIEDLVSPGGDLLIERSARDPAPPLGSALALRGSRAWGETRFDWYEREGGQEG